MDLNAVEIVLTVFASALIILCFVGGFLLMVFHKKWYSKKIDQRGAFWAGLVTVLLALYLLVLILGSVK